MEKIRVKDFVTKPIMKEPKTATYGNLRIMSESGYLHFIAHGVEILYFKVTTHHNRVCFVCKVQGRFEYRALLHAIMHSCEDQNSWGYSFYNWNDFEKCFLYLLEMLKLYNL